MSDNAIKQVLDWIEEEIQSLKNEINVRNNTLNSLQKLTDDLKEYDEISDYKKKYEEMSVEFEKEQKRLIKLHDHYKKIEEEGHNLRNELKNWQDWFNSNKDIYEKLFSAAPPKNLTGFDETSVQSPKLEKKKKSKKKKK